MKVDKHLRVKDVEASEVICSITEKVQQRIARRGDNLRHCLVAPHLRDDQATEEDQNRELWVPTVTAQKIDSKTVSMSESRQTGEENYREAHTSSSVSTPLGR